MELQKEQQRQAGGVDISKKWIKYLRKTKDPTVPKNCPVCEDRKLFENDKELSVHMHKFHPDKGPTAGEADKITKNSKNPNWEAESEIITSQEGSAAKPYVDLSRGLIEPNRDAQESKSRASAIPPSTSLTAGKLDGLASEIKRQDATAAVKHQETWSGERSTKKRAIGQGTSPTSSLITTCSNDVPRPPDGFSSGTPHGELTRDPDESEMRRPPTTGKRLFEPNNASYWAPVSSNATQRSRLSADQQPPRRNPKLSKSTGNPHPPQRSSTGIERSRLPPSMLSAPVGPQPDASSSVVTTLVRQPETRSITQEQLVAEVKGIYAGLVMVEGKCIQVDTKQANILRDAQPGSQPKLNNEQWQALIALHRTLLHEHHDFFLASQHPSATEAVQKLAIKYAMPARLWRHGIHSFLELLRNRLPDSLDHMLAFIYLAYSMMTLLYETVPVFADTWIECLGDLGRYRMAIEDDDIRDREVWTQVARQWYMKASARTPNNGRLYHHLAILARPNSLQQLFYYYKAMSVPQSFDAAKESILTVFEPVVTSKPARRLPLAITAFVKMHAALFSQRAPEGTAAPFSRRAQEGTAALLVDFIGHLDSHIGRVTQKYLEQGYLMAISNCLALLSFGSPDSVLQKALSNPTSSMDVDTIMMNVETTAEWVAFEEALDLFTQTIKVILERTGDPNILSFLHVIMIFMRHLSGSAEAMKLVQAKFPWSELVAMLNVLMRFFSHYSRLESKEPPKQEKNDFRPAPEEFALRGLLWTEGYFPKKWFDNKNIEDENQYKEDASMNSDYRPERILWLGCQLAKPGAWISHNSVDHKFSVVPEQRSTVTEIVTPHSPLDRDLDSGTESTTDTATIMADYDVEADEMSLQP